VKDTRVMIGDAFLGVQVNFLCWNFCNGSLTFLPNFLDLERFLEFPGSRRRPD
jgi:hypothetical protein